MQPGIAGVRRMERDEEIRYLELRKKFVGVKNVFRLIWRRGAKDIGSGRTIV